MRLDLYRTFRRFRRFAAWAPDIRSLTATVCSRAEDWSVSPFPDGRAFGFTIVHDADSAYSRRLAPLFEVFDEFRLQLTVTAFVLWADWAENGEIWRAWAERESDEFFAPQCVPLLDDRERQFYLDLAARGHEIGIHTPSDTSSERKDVIRAFEFFRQHFGRYPTVYVEHRAHAKKDAQAREGSQRSSIYYNTDLLNSYGPWVWIDDPRGVPHARHPQFYDILGVAGSPFNHAAVEQYGIQKAFLRSGRWKEGDGDGFLSHYSEDHIDALERNRGLALVYTHLDHNWLDFGTRKMRAVIKDRLAYLAAKNGWFVPAGGILDRLHAVQKLTLHHDKYSLTIVNNGTEEVEGLTVVSYKRRSLRRGNEIFNPTGRGDIVVGLINPGETLSFDVVDRQTSRFA